IAAVHTMMGEVKAPSVRATASQASPQLIAKDGAIKPRVKPANHSPAIGTTTRIATAPHSHPGKVLNPSDANHAAIFAVVATQTQPRYTPKVPCVNNVSVVDDGDVSRNNSTIRNRTASKTTMTVTLTKSSSS